MEIKSQLPKVIATITTLAILSGTSVAFADSAPQSCFGQYQAYLAQGGHSSYGAFRAGLAGENALYNAFIKGLCLI